MVPIEGDGTSEIVTVNSTSPVFSSVSRFPLPADARRRASPARACSCRRRTDRFVPFMTPRHRRRRETQSHPALIHRLSLTISWNNLEGAPAIPGMLGLLALPTNGCLNARRCGLPRVVGPGEKQLQTSLLPELRVVSARCSV